MLGGEDIIDTADGCGVWCRLHQIRIGSIISDSWKSSGK